MATTPDTMEGIRYNVRAVVPATLIVRPLISLFKASKHAPGPFLIGNDLNVFVADLFLKVFVKAN
jgi:hypothetical protein